MCEDCQTTVTWQYQRERNYGACRRSAEACRKSKLLREKDVEEMLVGLLKKLVCPTPEVVNWVSNAMRTQYRKSIENRQQQVAATQTQIDRIERMESMLYDDKLSGEITKGKYEEKHEQFVKAKAELVGKIRELESSQSKHLEEALVILELSQKAAEIYQNKPDVQKRLILSNIFEKLTLKGGIVSVKYTNFTKAIAEKVVITNKILEAAK